MADLPEADAATRAYLMQWLDTFAGYVREVDYASARPLFHPDVLAFGTHRDVIAGVQSWMDTQWDNVWPKTADFRFALDATRILAADDGSMAVAVAPWTSTGFHQDGSRFDRPGRATMIFHKSGGTWLCVHSHMSLNRGVPQQSHANRPVKAR
ncbi:YybH family protein [Limobrevibacterium gyesilva]|uniref:Nuclear transport factor 2 family protein n=1 Tax=Limobrevibacterium gyesilva TaxID=2991712 RepID=A0AA41YM87_9PROT|nr:nuclear transport factor 2 family protein [Limobrevibacterium gyesilva]MCW3473063.1 nuclear transport factor 2 family protein [Limobrevibacterium gyesilva]